MSAIIREGSICELIENERTVGEVNRTDLAAAIEERDQLRADKAELLVGLAEERDQLRADKAELLVGLALAYDFIPHISAGVKQDIGTLIARHGVKP